SHPSRPCSASMLISISSNLSWENCSPNFQACLTCLYSICFIIAYCIVNVEKCDGSNVPSALLQLRVQQICEPRARQRHFLFRQRLRGFFVLAAHRKWPGPQPDWRKVNRGLRVLNARVDPVPRVEVAGLC